MTIILDAMGSDKYPGPEILGAVEAKKIISEEIILVGNEDIINKEMKDAAEELRRVIGYQSRVKAKRDVVQKKIKAKKAAAKAVSPKKEKTNSGFVSDLADMMGLNDYKG